MPRPINTVYHLVDASNWPSVQKHGLMSARLLLQQAGEEEGDALRRHRPAARRLSSGALIRDQRPMPPNALARCLKSGVGPEDWFELLNSKIFFWLDPDRLNRQRLACGKSPQVALVVDAVRLLARHGAAATVTPINTGNAMRAAAPRNRSTFVRYERWRANGWADEEIPGVPCRSAGHRPVELTVDDAVPDIGKYLTAVVSLGAGKTLAWPLAG